MKAAWVRPLTLVERFEVNETISACGDYEFTCNGHGGWLYNNINWNGSIDEGEVIPLSTNYHSCNDTHTLTSIPETSNSVIRYATPVIRNQNVVMYEADGKYHTTSNISQPFREVARS